MQTPPSEHTKKVMRAVKSKGSKIEKRLALALWHRGHRYRKNDKRLIGKPDLTFHKYRLAIFIDSEFWHGKDWDVTKHDHKSNTDYWYAKIERNMLRDQKVNQALKEQGWRVMRFWGKEVEKELESCVNKIEVAINEQKEKLQDN